MKRKQYSIGAKQRDRSVSAAIVNLMKNARLYSEWVLSEPYVRGKKIIAGYRGRTE